MKTKLLMLILWLTYIAGNVSAQISFVTVFPNNGQIYDVLSARQTKDNGYILAAWGDLSLGTKIFHLIKTDSLGHIVAQGGGFAIETYGISAIPTSDNGHLFIVNITSSTNQYYSGFIKTDSMCNEIWSKFYDISGLMILGPVSQTMDSGYVTYCYTCGNNINMIRVNSIGDLLWSKSYGGAPGGGDAVCYQTNDSGFIAVGTISGFGAGGRDIYVVKTDPNGDTLWTRTYGGTGNDSGMDIKQTPDSGYIILGTTTSFASGNTYLIKTDVNGNLSWSKTYGIGGSTWGTRIELTPNGGYNIYCGDVVIKTDAFGDTLKIIKTFSQVVQQTSDGGYLVLASLSKTDSNGVSCYLNSPPPIITIGNPVTQTTQPNTTVNNLSITSWTASIYNGGIGGTDTTLCTTVGISPTPALPGGEGVAIAPNPFNSTATLTIPDHLFNDHLTLSIFNVDGRILRKQNITSHQTIIERNALAAGIYFYKLTSGRTAKTFGKLIIQ